MYKRQDLYHPKRKQLATTQLLREEFAQDTDVVVGFVGRLAAEKRVEQMATLFGIDPSVRFLVVGDGPERARLEADFAGQPVHFTGKLRGELLADAYAAIDVFVHFGTEETFGQTIQEAQAAGLAVVAPNSGGPAFLINHGQDGFLVDHKVEHSYRHVVTQLVHDSELRARVSEGARRAVLRKSWDDNNQQLIGYYQQAISQNHQQLSDLHQTGLNELV